MTNQPRTAADIAALLNAYEDEHRASDSNIWNDLIHILPEYDYDATAEADPNGRSDVVVLKDGSVVRWAVDRNRWAAE